MSLRYCIGNLILFICIAACSTARAHITTIAMTDLLAAGIPSADWDSLDPGTLSNAGAVAFTGRLKHEINNITAANDAGVWLYSESSASLLAQTGSAGVPDIVGASFAAFDQASLSETGSVAIIGDLQLNQAGVTVSNRQGIWRYSDLGNTLLARTGSGNVTGVVGADFEALANSANTVLFSLSGDGQIVISGELQSGVGGVLLNNDKGVWNYSNSGSSLLVREGISNVPSISGASFQEFTLPSTNSNNQQSFIASLELGGGIVTSNSTGVWRFTGSSGEMVARTGSGNVPGIAGADFSGFESPLLNDTGLVTLQAEISTGGEGIWLFSESTDTLLTRTGMANVPGVSNAHFEDLSVASINNLDHVLVAADLEVGPGGVSASDNQGLWLLNGGQGLIARTGSGNVPALPGANFASFAAHALNQQGQVAFAAALQTGVGGVNSTNDSGIWIVDLNGDAELVVREGQELAGRTIASLDFVSNSSNQVDAFNDLGQLAFQATFTDGASGLFLYQPLRADFNTDGFVGSADLAQWQIAYATTAAANADSDNDSDGADFLIWQREFGSGTPPLSTTSVVPEPACGLLIICTLLSGGTLMSRRRK